MTNKPPSFQDVVAQEEKSQPPKRRHEDDLPTEQDPGGPYSLLQPGRVDLLIWSKTGSQLQLALTSLHPAETCRRPPAWRNIPPPRWTSSRDRDPSPTPTGGGKHQSCCFCFKPWDSLWAPHPCAKACLRLGQGGAGGRGDQRSGRQGRGWGSLSCRHNPPKPGGAEGCVHLEMFNHELLPRGDHTNTQLPSGHDSCIGRKKGEDKWGHTRILAAWGAPSASF